MRIPFLILLAMVVTACSKDYDTVPYEKLNLPESLTYRDFFLTEDGRLVVCGGEENSGFIKYSDDAGNSWITVSEVFTHSVNALYFLNSDTGFCADGDIIIRRTTDGGATWVPFYDQTWPLTVNRNLRSIWFTSTEKGFVCGGKNLGNGVMYTTENSGNNWSWSEFNHEYRSVCFADTLNGIICGHGSLLYTTNGGNQFYSSNLTKYYLTGSCTDQNGHFLVCDLNGRVFRSANPAGNWYQIRDGSDWNVGSGQLNTISVSTSGKIAAAGPGGFITWSNDQGASWQDRTSFNGSDIFKVKWIDNETLMCAGQKGVFLITIN